MTADTFIAVDWGTTNRRAFLVRDGMAADVVRDDRGILNMDRGDYVGEIGLLRDRWGPLLVLVAGMAGSNRGWVEVPYVECPARLERLAQSIRWVEPGRTAIVSGLCQRVDRPDIMRGEEMQFFGAMAGGWVPPDALLCQPGTHCKWARAQSGAITGFATAMTGELFSLLKSHSLLAPLLQGEVHPGAAFAEGIADARNGDLAGALFGIRSASLLGKRDDRDAASYASGLLIGSDVAAHLAAADETVHLLAGSDLGELYAHAIDQMGGHSVLIDSERAFVSGAVALRTYLP